MKKILFICTGNTCRSPMAEGILKNIIKEDESLNNMEISSAGTDVYFKNQPTMEAVSALNSMNINITNHRATKITKNMIKQADLILTMTLLHKERLLSMDPSAHSKIYTIKEYINESSIDDNDILDPFGMSLNEYIKCSEELYNNLLKVKNKLKEVIKDDSAGM